MSRFFAAKHLSSLRPVDESGEDALRKLGQGELVEIEIKRRRNVKHHRKFWLLMSLVHNNLDGERYPTVEDLVSAVKIAAGHRTIIELPNGDVGFIPKSIAFHKMDQGDFDGFYDKVCDLICKHFIPGLKAADLKDEVEHMIGVRA